MASTPKRHLIVPDCQVRPNVHTDHIDWIAQSIVHYKPDVIVVIGDWWDFPSLNGHEKPGSKPLEGLRYNDDVLAGNAAFARLCKPMEDFTAHTIRAHRQRYVPRKVFCMGNHEARADRVASEDPKLFGTIGSSSCDTRDFERIPFLEAVTIDGIRYSHYFPQVNTGRPIGGEVNARLNKIGCSFVQGHEQGFRYGNRILANGTTWHGLVAGSCYTHREEYRGPHQKHWRGIVVLNDVDEGDFDVMPLKLTYLCRKYTGKSLKQYMSERYAGEDWSHL